MEFLFEHDFRRQAGSLLTSDLTGGDQSALGLAATAALAEARSHLATTRHDLPAIFAQIQTWAPGPVALGAIRQHAPAAWSAVVYAPGKVVASHDSSIWVSNTATTAQDVPGISSAWTRTGVLVSAIWTASAPTSMEPGSDQDWVQGDPRHPLLVMYLVDIALYHLSSKVDPRQVPDIRLQRREDAVRWLRDLAAGKVIDPNLPMVQEPEGTGFKVHSQPAIDFGY